MTEGLIVVAAYLAGVSLASIAIGFVVGVAVGVVEAILEWGRK